MDFASASAQLELRLLRIQPHEARRFQGLASHLLFPNPLLRPPAERIEENRKGQAGLWTYGISGDLPIALITIGERGISAWSVRCSRRIPIGECTGWRRPGDPQRGGRRL